MLRIDFHRPLTALEIRDPAIEVCREIAVVRNLHVTFDQPQQVAYSGYPGQKGRQRVGNGKHKDWYINYQEEEPRVSNPTIVGRIALKAPVQPAAMQFGGFDYGKYGDNEPSYNHVTLHTPSELGHYRPIDPEPDLLELTYVGLTDLFEGNYPRLFSIADYDM